MPLQYMQDRCTTRCTVHQLQELDLHWDWGTAPGYSLNGRLPCSQFWMALPELAPTSDFNLVGFDVQISSDFASVDSSPLSLVGKKRRMANLCREEWKGEADGREGVTNSQIGGRDEGILLMPKPDRHSLKRFPAS